MLMPTIERSAHWVCQTDSGRWYSDGINGAPIETNVEAIRMVHGEAAMNLARRTKKVVNVVLEAYDIDPKDFVG